jgi:hypothetical protein
VELSSVAEGTQFIQGGPADNSSVERVGTGVAPSAAINKAGFPYMRVITSVLGGFKEKVVL